MLAIHSLPAEASRPFVLAVAWAGPPFPPAGLPARQRVPSWRCPAEAMPARLLLRHEEALLPALPEGHLSGPGSAARLQALPSGCLLRRHQNGGPHAVPCRPLLHKALCRQRQRLPEVPRQRERGAAASFDRGCPAMLLAGMLSPALYLMPDTSTLSCCIIHNSSRSPTSLPLQTFSTASGATSCQKCSAIQWTARLAGQKACWSVTKRLP